MNPNSYYLPPFYACHVISQEAWSAQKSDNLIPHRTANLFFLMQRITKYMVTSPA